MYFQKHILNASLHYWTNNMCTLSMSWGIEKKISFFLKKKKVSNGRYSFFIIRLCVVCHLLVNSASFFIVLYIHCTAEKRCIKFFLLMRPIFFTQIYRYKKREMKCACILWKWIFFTRARARLNTDHVDLIFLFTSFQVPRIYETKIMIKYVN